MENSNFFFSPTRSRQDIRGNSKALLVRNLSTLNSYKNRRSRSRSNLVEAMLKTQGQDRYQVQARIISFIAEFATHQDNTKSTTPYTWYKSSNYGGKKTVYRRCPTQFCTFRTEIFTTSLKRTCKCTPNHPSFVLLF